MLNQIYYFDISKTGKDYVGKRDISLLTNEQSVLESIRNILSTEVGERVMNPTFGCALSNYLFEPIDQVTLVAIKSDVINAIKTFEPRVDKLDVQITEYPDTNSIEIVIMFNMKMSTNVQSLTLYLNKIR